MKRRRTRLDVGRKDDKDEAATEVFDKMIRNTSLKVEEAWICQRNSSRCWSWSADEFSEGVQPAEEVSEARVQFPKSGGGDYEQNYDKPSSLSHPVSGGNTGCDDTIHRTRYKIIHFIIYIHET
ncbi:hypothetical protein Tco_1224196 [Tanacetum coccineum]